MKRIFFTLLIVIIILLLIFYYLGHEMDVATKNEADGTNEYAVILGAKVKQGGVPSLSLVNRLDAAIPYLEKYPQIKVIVSGGQGEDEDRTEASVMANYLIERGIDKNRILQEDQSTSTYENLYYSQKLLPEHVTSITIISNDFHLKRAMFLAQKIGLQTDVIPARTPKIVESKSRLRERLALIKAYVTGQ